MIRSSYHKKQIEPHQRKTSPVILAQVHAEDPPEAVEVESLAPPKSPAEEGEIEVDDESGTSQAVEQVTMTISNDEVTRHYSTSSIAAMEPRDEEVVQDEPCPEFSPLPEQSQVRQSNIISEK
jgi:hypothetical protein